MGGRARSPNGQDRKPGLAQLLLNRDVILNKSLVD
jgi:hypothetical protein